MILKSTLKPKDIRKWHKHFCWFPVRIGENDIVWLQYLERKLTYQIVAEDEIWVYKYIKIGSS